MLAELFDPNADLRDAFWAIAVALFIVYAVAGLSVRVATALSGWVQVLLGLGLACGFLAFLFAS